MEIKITEYISESGLVSGFNVYTNGHLAEGLSPDELLGLIASLTMPDSRPCLQWLQTPEQIERKKLHFEALKQRRRDYVSECPNDQQEGDQSNF